MDENDLTELYQDLILQHSSHPLCKGDIESFPYKGKVYNPLCGDEVAVGVDLDENNIIKEIKFQGKGCSISQASASIMCSLCKGKDIKTVEDMHNKFISLVHGKLAPQDAGELGDALALSGVKRFPARTRCAIIAWEALMSGLQDQLHKGHGST